MPVGGRRRGGWTRASEAERSDGQHDITDLEPITQIDPMGLRPIARYEVAKRYAYFVALSLRYFVYLIRQIKLHKVY